MYSKTFDHYSQWAKPLTKQMLRQIENISEKKVIPEIAGLLRRICDMSAGIEQKIIVYR